MYTQGGRHANLLEVGSLDEHTQDLLVRSHPCHPVNHPALHLVLGHTDLVDNSPDDRESVGIPDVEVQHMGTALMVLVLVVGREGEGGWLISGSLVAH